MPIKSISRISTASDGTEGNHSSNDPVFSPDGSKVMFTSLASNLVEGDSFYDDIFIKDLNTGSIERVSVAADGTQPDGYSGGHAFSPDGSKAAFFSFASNLVSDDTNVAGDVFIKDLVTGAVERISTAPDGTQGTAGSGDAPAFSPDGSRVAFASYARNFVPGDVIGTFDIFVKTLATGAIERISNTVDGTPVNGISHFPVFSPDGTRVAFLSEASNLVSDDTNGGADIFVAELATGTIQRLSTDANGNQANGRSTPPVFSPDGSKIVFASDASNLITGDTNGAGDVFIKDLATGAVERVSVAADGTQANGYSYGPVFSPDGNHVAFWSSASNLVSGDTNGNADVFVKDLVTGAIERVSYANDGTQANGDSRNPVFSPDGTRLSFESDASNLVPGDTNGNEMPDPVTGTDIFVVELDFAPPPQFTFSFEPTSVTVDEGVGLVPFTVTRSDTTAAATIYASTVQNQGFTNDGDYVGKINEPVEFAAGQSFQVVSVQVTDDTIAGEPDETFGLIVQNDPTAPITEFLASATFTIQDNEGTVPGANLPPVVAAETQQQSLQTGTEAQADAWWTATDPDGDPITWWAVYDKTPGLTSASFSIAGEVWSYEQNDYIDGATIPPEERIALTAAQFADLTVQAGSEALTDSLYAIAWDGTSWGDWAEVALTTTVDDGTPGSIDTVAKDTSTTAVLAAGQTVSGTIDQNDLNGDAIDADYYQVSLAGGHRYTFTGNAGVSTSDTLDAIAMRLRDASGNILLPDTLVDGARPSFSFDAPGTGDATYYLAVSAGGSGAFEDKTGDFTVSLVDDGVAPPTPVSYSIAPESVTVNEGAGTVTFTVSRSDDTAGGTVYASTVPNWQGNGIANDGDYVGKLNEPVVFAAGDGEETVTVQINDDNIPGETAETFGLIVQQSPSDPLTSFLASATFTIQENDAASPDYGIEPPYSVITAANSTPPVVATIGQIETDYLDIGKNIFSIMSKTGQLGQYFAPIATNYDQFSVVSDLSSVGKIAGELSGYLQVLGTMRDIFEDGTFNVDDRDAFVDLTINLSSGKVGALVGAGVATTLVAGTTAPGWVPVVIAIGAGWVATHAVKDIAGGITDVLTDYETVDPTVTETVLQGIFDYFYQDQPSSSILNAALRPATLNVSPSWEYNIDTGELKSLRQSDPATWEKTAQRFGIDTGTEPISLSLRGDLNPTDNNDLLIGGVGHDKANGGSGDDRIAGLGGNDFLRGGEGNDEYLGGDGADVFVGSASDLDGDSVLDFTPDDTLRTEGVRFTEENLTVSQGSAILDIDTNGDGTKDTTVTLEGDFPGTFNVTPSADGEEAYTDITYDPTPVIDDPEGTRLSFATIKARKLDKLGDTLTTADLDGVSGSNHIQDKNLYALLGDGDAQLEDGETAFKLADMGYGSRVTKIAQNADAEDPVAISGHGRINNNKVGARDTIGFNDDWGFGLDNGPESGNRWLNSGDSVSWTLTNALGNGAKLTFASFIVDARNAAADVALDADGDVVNTGKYKAGATIDNANASLELASVTDGARVEIDFMNESVEIDDVVQGDTEPFFDRFAETNEKTLTIGGITRDGFSVDELVLETDALLV